MVIRVIKNPTNKKIKSKQKQIKSKQRAYQNKTQKNKTPLTKQQQINIKFFLKHKKTLFYCEVDQNWHRLPRDLVEFPSLEIFKSYLNMGMGSLF